MKILEKFELEIDDSKDNSCTMIRDWPDEIHNVLQQILIQNGYLYKEEFHHCKHYDNCMRRTQRCEVQNCSSCAGERFCDDCRIAMPDGSNSRCGTCNGSDVIIVTVCNHYCWSEQKHECDPVYTLTISDP